MVIFMNGLLLINKDKGYTSRDCINILSKVLNTKKIGHFGTLDPLATGLLVVGVGKYTKAQKILDRVNNWYFDCDSTYTLRPDGEFVFGCPHKYNVSFAQKCLSCSKSLTCRPCKLQSLCSFPEELYRKVNFHENSRQI